ncbi:MAG TPA: hypothetical protein VEL28_11490 [Candidatus Binatia bacterium]|nr:hypothetical protein [Candidatus Binatia bacterium]
MPTVSVNTLATLYADFASNSLGRCRRAVERAQTGSYTINDYWADWTAFNIEAYRLAMYPYNLIFSDLGPPTCEMNASKQAGRCVESIEVDLGPGVALSCSELTDMANMVALPMKAEVGSSGKSVIITVDSLDDAVVGQVYQGTVYRTGQPDPLVATVILHVEA